MIGPRLGLCVASLLLLAACSQAADTASSEDGAAGSSAAGGSSGEVADAGAETAASNTTTSGSATSDATTSDSTDSDSATSGSATSDSAAGTSATTVVTSSTAEGRGARGGQNEASGRDRACVTKVKAGDSLSVIASRVDRVSFDELLDENRLTAGSVIHPGQELDVCPGNDVDDVTGTSLLPPGPRAVRKQQTKLNELFAPYMIADLAVDGDSGPLTRQMLCAARMGLGLPVHTEDMPEGSPEETALFEASSLRIPSGAATWAGRWILIDQTCQVMYVGEGGDGIVNVYPTSTGEPGYETRTLQGATAFRFDPALDNGGWHDSSRFPVPADDPLNGNMYKPLYFSAGQAIHGANYVPPSPKSKGCARMFPWHQDDLISWLGLDDVTEPLWRQGEIGVTVSVQGAYQPPDPAD